MDLSNVNDTQLRVRIAQEEDRTYLLRLLYLTSVFGDESEALPESHIPDVQRYVGDWSPLVDGGVLAFSNFEVPAGGAWLRYFTGDEKGAAYMGPQSPDADPHDESLWATEFDPESIPELCIAVERRYAGQGLGKILLDNVVELARQQDAPAVALWVDSENPRARKLYEAAGFSDIDIPNAAPGAMIKYF
ncbi:GNAT family N-acetyltransferase [Corynebacterium casei]|uniref:N-acetyltransferase n=2 Tax=Corynebacterium TaxID=1716 RepID=A0ABN4CB36_9CORY|nr:GNAT family N-acetyltransferase [Corynebacterium casei]AHI19280.1 N-acetyltransferase [Corynebacterium casei LMG S-19264]